MYRTETARRRARPTALIPLGAIPQALGILMCAWQVRLGEMRFWALAIALCCVMGTSALVCIGYAVWKRRENDIPQPLVLTLLAQGVCAFAGLIALTYPMPRPTHPLNLEVTLTLLGGAQAAGLCFLLCLQREAGTSAREICYGFLLPFACALGFSAWRTANQLTNAMLCLAIGMACLAALFLLRWARTFCGPEPSGAAAESEKDAMVQTANGPAGGAPEEIPAPGAGAGNAAPGRRGFRPHESTPFIAVFALIFPLVGLGLNQAMRGAFLDASHPLFPVIALANGVLMLPELRAKFKNLPLLYLQMIGFTYIAYFALIFIPAMPAGLAGLLIGFGALILTPATLFGVELVQIMGLYKALRARHSAGAIGTVMLAGALTLPALLGINAAADRANYQNALAVVARSGQHASVDTNRLARTLSDMNRVNARFDRGTGSFTSRSFDLDWIGSESLPILSTLYGAFVYDELPVGKAMATDLYETFFSGGAAKQSLRPDMSSWGITTKGFALKSYGVRTEFDKENGVYLSWVDLEIQSTLSGVNSGQREFETTFHLPRGNFVTDYYLYVGPENKQGLLSERRAANMVYQSVVNRSQDPGILDYLDDETLRLRVFPFSGGEVRRTGFRVMHIEPVTLRIEGERIALGAPEPGGAPVHTARSMGAHGADCAPGGCDEILPAADNAYDNARILFHNTRVSPNDVERVWDSFRQRVLSRATTFIVLESAEQEATLRALQQRILNGEQIPDRFVSMDEPGALIAAALAAAMLILARRRRRPATGWVR